MSWQDELRKLDEELAAGRISADDYRIRRDQALAQAVSASGAPRADQQSAEATQMVTPVAPPQPDVNDRTQAVINQSQPGFDRTQVVGNQGPTASADDTQIVSNAGQWQMARPDENERTQVVSGGPPQGGYRPQQDHGGYTPQDEPLAPPWAGSEFPPMAVGGSPDWIRQGPEVFESDGKSGGSKIALIALAVVVVLGLGVGAYFMFFAKSDNNDPAPKTSASAPSTTVKPKDDLEIADLPGSPEIAPEIETLADVETNKLLTDGEVKVYKDAVGSKARLAVSKLSDKSQALVLTIQVDSPALAGTARDGLAGLQAEYGMAPYTGVTPPGVKITQIAGSGTSPATIRGHYIHKKTVVRVQVYGADMAEASKKFDDIMTTQLEELPADD